MKTLLFAAFGVLWSIFAFPQNKPIGIITGQIYNGESKEKLPGASVALLPQGSDQVKYSASSDASGNFRIPSIEIGIYQVVVKFMGYQPVIFSVEFSTSKPTVDIGAIHLMKIPISLKQIDIVQKKAILKHSKDTLEFNASYYPTRETDMMRELLKKLPGVEISTEGIITINGQEVKQILVDGKPYFGRNTKIATDNLLSGIVKSIQFIDRKPDAYEIQNGNTFQTEKAINVTLEHDQYGKVDGLLSAAGGPEGKFALRTKLNRFERRRQTSILANSDNINGLDEYHVGLKGINTSFVGGINFNQDWSNRLSFTGSYYLDNLKSMAESKSLRQNSFPGEVSNYNLNSMTRERSHIHAIEASLSYKIDSLSNLQFNSRAILSRKISDIDNSYTTMKSQIIQNNGKVDNRIDGRTGYYFNNLGFKRQFNHPAQQLRIDLSVAYNFNPSDLTNHSLTSYFTHDTPDRTDTINQFRMQRDRGSTFQFSASYAQAINQKWSLNLDLISNYSTTSSNRQVKGFDEFTHSYGVLVDSLSGGIQNSNFFNKAVIGIKVTKSICDLTIGANLYSNNQLTNSIGDHLAYKRNFTNLSPAFDLNLRISKKSFLHAAYDTRLLTPDPGQLFQLPDHTDPLYIRQGNPNLLPTLTHYLNLDYRKINPTNGSTFLATGFLGMLEHQMVNTTNMDSVGRQYTSLVNANGAWFTGIFISLSLPLNIAGMTAGGNNSSSVIMDRGYVNGQLNSLNRFNLLQQAFLRYSPKENMDFAITATLSYNTTSSKLQPDSRTNYFDYNFSLNANTSIFWNLFFTSSCKYTLATGRSDGYNNDRLVINLSLSKPVIKNSRGLIKVQVFDLLNRNFAYIRNVGETYVEDIQTKTISRLFLVGFTYYLKKDNSGK